VRILLLGALFSVGAFGCDCRPSGVRESMERHEIVFRGTIVGFRQADKPSEMGSLVHDTGRIVIFHVDRVWKGDIGKTLKCLPLKRPRPAAAFGPRY